MKCPRCAVVFAVVFVNQTVFVIVINRITSLQGFFCYVEPLSAPAIARAGELVVTEDPAQKLLYYPVEGDDYAHAITLYIP